MTTVEGAIQVYWTSPFPLTVLLIFATSLATLSYIYLTNARNPGLRVSILTGLYGLSTFLWLFILISLVLCVLQKDMIAYQTAGVQVVVSTAIGLGLSLSSGATLYVWRRAPIRLLASLQSRYAASEAGWLQDYVDLLASHKGIQPPQVLVLDMDRSECMAISTPKADFIVVARKLLSLLDRKEMEAAVAHEFVHILNRDARSKVFSAVMSRFLFFDPISKFLDPAVHREREYLADELGAKLHGSPSALASALLKLHESSPSSGARWSLGLLGLDVGFFCRYPPLKERIRRLLFLSEILARG